MNIKFTSDIFDISVTVEKSTMQICLDPITDLDGDIVWKVEIRHEECETKIWDFNRDLSFEYDLEKPGTYGIFVVAKNNDLQFRPLEKAVHYYTPEIHKAYKEFLDSGSNDFEKDPLPLYCPQVSLQNIALVCANNEEKSNILLRTTKMIKSISPELRIDYLWNKQNKKAIAVSQSGIFDKRIIFSGTTKYNGKMILGQNDLEEGMDYQKLTEEIGMWSALCYSPDQISFTNDYYGNFRLYYYNKNGFTVVSNNYHMLLLILKKLNINLTFNFEESLPNLLLPARTSLLAQRLSHKMDIDDVFALPIDKFIQFNGAGMIIKNKSIYNDLNGAVEYDEAQYEEIVKKSADEIKENVFVALNDDRFKNIIVDLTGGKDSRTVFAAAHAVNSQHGGKFTDKIRLFTNRKPDNSNDFDVAVGISNMFGYEFDDRGQEYVAKTYKENELITRSFYIGQSFEYNNYTNLCTCVKDDCVKLTGAGELAIRPYYIAGGLILTRDFFESDDIDLITDKIISITNETEKSIINNDTIDRQYRRILMNTIREMPGSTLMEKVDIIALFFRNVYHFGSRTALESAAMNLCKTWQPLFSKHTLPALKMCVKKDMGIKFQLDLMSELCPILAVLPFESKKDNAEYERVKDTLMLDYQFRNLKIIYNKNPARWSSANKTRSAGRKIVNSEEVPGIEKENKEYWANYFDNMLKSLKKLLMCENGAYKDFGLDLFYYITHEKENFNKKDVNRRVQWLYNKITSITDQIDIVVGE